MKNKFGYLMVRLSDEDKETLGKIASLYFEGNMSLTIRFMIRAAAKDNNWFPDSINTIKSQESKVKA